MQIRAIAIKTGYTDSQTLSATYTVGHNPPSYSAWQLVNAGNPEQICNINPGEAVTYYTAESTLDDFVVLYENPELTRALKGEGYYLDIDPNHRDPKFRTNIVWRIRPETGEILHTSYTCTIL